MTAGEEPWPPADSAAARFAPADFATVDFELAVNGTAQPVTGAWVGESLLFALRERLGLVAAKDGCGEGECGACTILMDGQPTVACVVPAVSAVGRDVRTPEIYAVPRPDPIAAALASRAGTGCGYCLPGIGMEMRALLARNPKPSAAAVRESLSGHRCRCLPAERFVDAVNTVVAQQQPKSAEPETAAVELATASGAPTPSPAVTTTSPAPAATAAAAKTMAPGPPRLDESGSWSWQVGPLSGEAADRA
jgi:aerobic-type carbon monoxide dehydrogenase small subunit (CoxS/CutS family)